MTPVPIIGLGAAVALMVVAILGLPAVLQVVGVPIPPEVWMQLIGGLVAATVTIVALRGQMSVLREQLHSGLKEVLHESKEYTRNAIDRHVREHHQNTRPSSGRRGEYDNEG